MQSKNNGDELWNELMDKKKRLEGLCKLVENKYLNIINVNLSEIQGVDSLAAQHLSEATKRFVGHLVKPLKDEYADERDINEFNNILTYIPPFKDKTFQSLCNNMIETGTYYGVELFATTRFLKENSIAVAVMILHNLGEIQFNSTPTKK